MMNIKRIILSASALVIAAASLAGCGESKAVPIGIDTAVPSINIMTTATRANPAGPNSPVVQEMERYLGEKMSEKYGKSYEKVNLDINWIASTAYGEKVTAAMGASEYPHVMLVTTRNSSVIQNSKHGTFWDITDAYSKTDPKYVTDENPEGYTYPNLAHANPMILKNISVDGKIYGIYRSRTIGRQGVTIRKDWLDKLGLGIPETVDDLGEVLKAFTEKDPDGDGQKNTYGMIITTYLDGPLGNLAIWMGAPNSWGYDEETGEWKPWFMSEGYFNALLKLREWYAAGYINKNMATLDANDWDRDFINGVAGMQIDVADRAKKNATNIVSIIPDAEVDVFGYVKKDKDTEPRTWPTTGHGGYYVFPKKSLPDENDLDFVLSVLDECSSEYIVDLCNFGIEGVHYTLDADGKAIRDESEDKRADYWDLPQFSMAVVPTKLKTAYVNAVDAKLEDVYEENEGYAVANPMESYTSEFYSMSGTQLDTIKKEAEVNFITGNLDEAGYRKAMEQWLKMDGKLVCRDYKEAYESDESNLDENGNVVIPDEYKYKFKF